jgi:energy-coupling factor transport system ATP-binding protein
MSIQVNNLTHIYSEGLPQESRALDGVTFTAADGQFIGIIGHTGSGKSTLVQHLNGLLKPTEGTIIVGDTDITAPGVVMNDIRKRIGLVFQYPEYQLFEETVEKDVAFGPKNLGLGEEEIAVRVKESLELVGLDYEKIRDRSPFDLSGGQKRRVAIAGVIAMKPEVLILDEPTAGLDPKAHQDVLDMVVKIHEHEKNIIILVSHNMNDIVEVADRIMVMHKGELKEFDTPERIFESADKLKRYSLDLPAAAKIADGLRKNGIDIPKGVLSVKDLSDALLKIISKEGSINE